MNNKILTYIIQINTLIKNKSLNNYKLYKYDYR